MVSLAKYLVADSVESYKEDPVDGQDVEALYDPVELQTRLAYRRTVAPDLRALLEEWSRGFVQLNVVENRLSELIDVPATPGPSNGSRARSTATRRWGCWSRATCSSTAPAPGPSCATCCCLVPTSTLPGATRRSSISSTRS